jgi:hypothetical protein
MGLVYCPLVRWTGSRLAAGPSDPMDDDNTLTQKEIMTNDKKFERSVSHNRQRLQGKYSAGFTLLS